MTKPPTRRAANADASDSFCVGQFGAFNTAWAQLREVVGQLREVVGQLREVVGQLREVVGQLRRPSGRRAWAADVQALPAALRWALPWSVLGRTSRDANPCRWLERQARRRPDVIAVSERTRVLTFAQLRNESLAAAEALRRLGAAADTRIAILLPTGVDLVATLLGCWRLGAVPCPLDPNTPASLLDEIRPQLGAKLEISDLSQLSEHCGTSSADRAKAAQASAPALCERLGEAAVSSHPSRANLPTSYVPMHAARLAMILPTSGSEGHVKLCRITAGRLALSGHAFGGVALGCRRGDVIYCPLPLCHATGITVGLLPALVHGVTLHLPGKFSASKLMQELQETRATQLVYVGDLLRMAVAATTTTTDRHESGRGKRPSESSGKRPSESSDKGSSESSDESCRGGVVMPPTHRVRVAVGNGLDQPTYLLAAKRLRIPRIVEFYGATEAPRVLLNLSGKAGSCGRVALRRMSRFVVVKQRVTTSSEDDPSPQRNASEWVRCEPGEVGELWIRIPSRQRSWLGDFEGYLDRVHEHRVVLTNVLQPGDSYYRTRDLVRYDEDDYFYFVDRLGDVWRNLGHNVSTTWLANELRQVEGVNDGCVFALALDDSARRFGVALLVMANEDRTRDALTKKIRNLPNYARPHLIQLVRCIPRTHSYKPKRPGGADTLFQLHESAQTLFVWDRGVLRVLERDAWSTQRQLLLDS